MLTQTFTVIFLAFITVGNCQEGDGETFHEAAGLIQGEVLVKVRAQNLQHAIMYCNCSSSCNVNQLMSCLTHKKMLKSPRVEPADKAFTAVFGPRRNISDNDETDYVQVIKYAPPVNNQTSEIQYCNVTQDLRVLEVMANYVQCISTMKNLEDKSKIDSIKRAFGLQTLQTLPITTTTTITKTTPGNSQPQIFPNFFLISVLFSFILFNKR
ncbi:hypothetical protein CHUAL_008939 [Chamberlinius hualienensis]